MLDLEDLRREAQVAIETAIDALQLENIKALYIGKNGKVTLLLKQLATASPEERPKLGQVINQTKEAIQTMLAERFADLEEQNINQKLLAETIDVTLPGRGATLGSLHPVTLTQNFIEDFFIGLGFTIAEGPEVEDDYHNFEALNFPKNHPARHMHDTFYFPDGRLLRTHTSPMQIRFMQENQPPIRLIVPGKVYRCDSDATHSPMFHQLEGLFIDRNVSLADLKGMMIDFLRYFFGRQDLQFRFRPSYFPFTEPSAEVDLLWKTADGESRWLEVCGCGMVHPHVLEECKIDTEVYQGWAFGFGIDRLAMLRFGIDDLRLFFQNDLKFLEQFSS